MTGDPETRAYLAHAIAELSLEGSAVAVHGGMLFLPDAQLVTTASCRSVSYAAARPPSVPSGHYVPPPKGRAGLLQKRCGMSQSGFDEAVEAFRSALDALLHGDANPVKKLWSRRDDVTVANPFGPPRRGPAQVDRAIEEAAANYTGGSRRFDEVSRFSTPDLGYVVQLEHTEAILLGRETAARFTLRVTMIFRREEVGWKVAHRHADTVTTARTIDTVITS